jgi:hypothetical protein
MDDPLSKIETKNEVHSRAYFVLALDYLWTKTLFRKRVCPKLLATQKDLINAADFINTSKRERPHNPH